MGYINALIVCENSYQYNLVYELLLQQILQIDQDKFLHKNVIYHIDYMERYDTVEHMMRLYAGRIDLILPYGDLITEETDADSSVLLVSLYLIVSDTSGVYYSQVEADYSLSISIAYMTNNKSVFGYSLPYLDDLTLYWIENTNIPNDIYMDELHVEFSVGHVYEWCRKNAPDITLCPSVKQVVRDIHMSTDYSQSLKLLMDVCYVISDLY